MTSQQKQNTGDRLAALRGELQARGLDGFIIPHDDEFQSEYLPPSAERLAWVTGFTGSAGIAAVLKDKAVAMTDGRYTLQIAREVESSLFATANMMETSAGEWIASNAVAGAKIGYDPRLHTESDFKQMQRVLKAKKIELVPVDSNPVDAVWAARPAPPATTVTLFPESIAGRSAADKRGIVAKGVNDNGAAAVVLAEAVSVAWLLNIRGKDIDFNPLALSYAIVHDNGEVDWFIDGARVPADVRQALGNQVVVRAPADLEKVLGALAARAKTDDKPVMIDSGRAPVWFSNILKKQGAEVLHAEDPCLIPRACKTAQEQQAMINAHVRDGVAMVRFLKWLDEEAPKGGLTEMDVADRLESFRRMDPACLDLSFDTIAGWAENGAVIHYKASADTNKTITPPGMLLLDSGAQYLEGTTDITRTLAVGELKGPQAVNMKRDFTLVLKGHIGVAKARFPEGATGGQIDGMARAALWGMNKDYDHGTGHGVGCYLGVHEEAATITPRGARSFKAGMVISNEPGFYKKDAYGIRIESLVLVKEDGVREGSSKKMLAFDTITMCPIDQRLIEPDLLDIADIEWLNAYHEKVYQTLSPHLSAAENQWLLQATAPLKKNQGLNPGALPVISPAPVIA